MATVDKNFRVKNGLVVEGSTGTIDGYDILTAAAIENGAEENENITVTYNSTDNKLTFVAENGVTDSTTADLEEGTVNLYFTPDRVTDTLVDTTYVEWVNATATKSEGLLTIDIQGSVEESTTDDLQEGTTNLYFTETRVYDKVKSILVEGTGINLTSADEAETITIDVDTTEIATREYVDALAESLHIHASVAAATEENINLASPPSTIDGVTLVEGMRILVKDQTNATQNGIYVFEDGSLVRAEDHDTADEIQSGDFVFVSGGTLYNSTGWVQINTVDVLGDDPVAWTQFLGAGTFVGGTGIDIDGQEISIDFTEFDTDEIDEGSTNLYFTDQRVEDVIAYLTTDELDEGTTNLYFTDERAVDALEAIIPDFDAVEINSIVKQIATSGSISEETVVLSWAKASYRSAKLLVKAAHSAHTEISEVLLTLDTSDNVAITEYAIVSTNGNLIDITASVTSTDVEVLIDPVNSATDVKVFGTLIV
jgi:hypothetical protein